MVEMEAIKVLGIHGPTAGKVILLCEKLALPYETEAIPLTDVKNPNYVAINPDGRLQSIQDPNTGLTLWESGAIIEYLTERYDKTHKLSFVPGTFEAYHARQWLFYQTTGQGPYYGQANVVHHISAASRGARAICQGIKPCDWCPGGTPGEADA